MSNLEYGYINPPTQSSSSNNGIFGSDDVYDLLNDGKWALQTIERNVHYLLIPLEVEVVRSSLCN